VCYAYSESNRNSRAKYYYKPSIPPTVADGSVLEMPRTLSRITDRIYLNTEMTRNINDLYGRRDDRKTDPVLARIFAFWTR